MERGTLNKNGTVGLENNIFDNIFPINEDKKK